MAPPLSEARLAPAESSDGVQKRARRVRFKLLSGDLTAELRLQKQDRAAPVVAQNKDHIVLDLKDGHPCTIWSVFVIWSIFFFPYSWVFPPTITAALYIAYRQLGHSVWIACGAMCVLSLICPLYYNRSFREKYFRPLHMNLAYYAKSSRVVIPARKYPPGKRYVFGLHPHGRVMYSTLLLSQLNDVFRRVLPEGGGDVFGGVAATFFYVPIFRSEYQLQS